MWARFEAFAKSWKVFRQINWHSKNVSIWNSKIAADLSRAGLLNLTSLTEACMPETKDEIIINDGKVAKRNGASWNHYAKILLKERPGISSFVYSKRQRTKKTEWEHGKLKKFKQSIFYSSFFTMRNVIFIQIPFLSRLSELSCKDCRGFF